jgi:hypothetical protein
LATSRESVSFHRPERSVTADGSMRVTCLVTHAVAVKRSRAPATAGSEETRRLRSGMVGLLVAWRSVAGKGTRRSIGDSRDNSIPHNDFRRLH